MVLKLVVAVLVGVVVMVPVTRFSLSLVALRFQWLIWFEWFS